MNNIKITLKVRNLEIWQSLMPEVHEYGYTFFTFRIWRILSAYGLSFYGGVA